MNFLQNIAYSPSAIVISTNGPGLFDVIGKRSVYGTAISCDDVVLNLLEECCRQPAPSTQRPTPAPISAPHRSTLSHTTPYPPSARAGCPNSVDLRDLRLLRPTLEGVSQEDLATVRDALRLLRRSARTVDSGPLRIRRLAARQSFQNSLRLTL